MNINEVTTLQDTLPFQSDSNIIDINIQDEMRQSFLDYAMSVIVARAIPDVRDGLKPVHRRILYAMHDLNMTPDKPYKKSARIVGECFVKGTLVSTPKGLIPIEKLKKSDEVYTQKGIKKVTELYIMPKQKLIEVELGNGLKNICTGGQKFKVFTPELEFVWKRADELKETDYMVLKSAYPEINDYVQIDDLAIDEDLAYLFGFFITDGWIDRDKRGYDRISFAGKNIKILEKIKEIIETKFSISVNIIEKGKGFFFLRINTHNVNQKLIKIFNIKDKLASNIKIPDFMFSSPPKVIYSFISGVIDGDGSVHKNRNTLNITSISETFIRQLQVLLLNLGVIGKIYKSSKKIHFYKEKLIKGNSDVYSLEVNSIYLDNLAKHLKLYNTVKKFNLERIKNFKPSKYEEVPYIGQYIFKEFHEKHLGGGWYLSPEGEKIRAGLKYPDGTKIRYSKDLVQTIRVYKSNLMALGILIKLQLIGSIYFLLLKEFLKNNIWFIKVKNVKETYEDVTYDIQVEDEHEFVGNGMVVSNCLGKYHPHGDKAVYDAMVRMAQLFSTRYPLVDGQGNFGSIDDDPPAAMRYTEARLSPIATEMLADLECNTVDFVPNFDATLEEPQVLPSAIPNLLINGSTGIAVGMATNIPPHNLKEVIDALVYIIDNKDARDEDLLQFIQGPDFPTGGIILKTKGLYETYTCGRGSVTTRGVVKMETSKTGRCTLVIEEIPYLVNKQTLVELIASLVQDKKIEGIADLRDESDRSGMRVVIELKRDANHKIVLNNLYKHTQLQQNYTFMMLTLVNGQPCILNLRDMLLEYLEHRFHVISKRTKYYLDKASARNHILEGFLLILDNLNEVIALIRSSDDANGAVQELCNKFNLTNTQATAVLDMPLKRLTGLEKQKIQTEHNELLTKIDGLTNLFNTPSLISLKIKEELLKIGEKYKSPRRTQIIADPGELCNEDLIPDEPMAVFITDQGYIKRILLDTFEKQKRGGMGVGGMKTREEDFIRHFFISSSHNYVMFFTNKGLMYRLKVYEIPEASRQAKGTAIANLLELRQNEIITAVIPISQNMEQERYLIMLTRKGIIKKVVTTEFFHSERKMGLIAINLDEDDELGWVCQSEGNNNLVIATEAGKAVHFSEKLVRSTGRNARGVKAITLKPGDKVIGFTIIESDRDLLTVATNGYGKRTPIKEYPSRLARGSQGIINIRLKEKSKVASILAVSENDEIIIVTSSGKVIRQKVQEISQLSRATQGVRLQKLEKKDFVVAVAPVIGEEEDKEEMEQAELLI